MSHTGYNSDAPNQFPLLLHAMPGNEFGLPGVAGISTIIRRSLNMPSQHGPSVKKDDTYEELRQKGASKEKAARIANAQANRKQQPSKKGGKASPYEDWTKKQLYDRAAELEIDGRSSMNKMELIQALRDR